MAAWKELSGAHAVTLVEMGESKHAEIQGPVADLCRGRLKGKMKLQRRPRTSGHQAQGRVGVEGAWSAPGKWRDVGTWRGGNISEIRPGDTY